MTIEASVVIPTYKRSELLSQCLYAVINQSLECGRYEIIVVTDGPDDKSVETVNKIHKQFHFCPPLQCISLNFKQGPAAARNAGWKIAKGELIIFTDDDCVPLFYWIENFLKAYRESNRIHIAFTGKIKVPILGRPTDHAKNTALLEEAEFVTANCACTKKALEKIGGFDEDFTMAWREDSALQFDFYEENIPIKKVAEAIIIHPVRSVPWGVSIKEQRKSMFNPLLYKKHPALYQQKIHNGPPWYYYGIIFLSITALTSAAFQSETIMRFSVTGCLGLVTWFMCKRLTGASLKLSHVLEMFVTSFIIPFLSVFWTMYGAIRYKTFFLWNNHKQPILKLQS
jgi:glycosyltransferase involved in cell wall biosynthesis